MRTCDRCHGIVAKSGQVIEYGPGGNPPILCHCQPHKDSYLNPGQLGTLAPSFYPQTSRVFGHPEMNACGCIGPQNGEPLCPCQMRSVKIIDGRYVRVTDLGPAPAAQAKLL